MSIKKKILLYVGIFVGMIITSYGFARLLFEITSLGSSRSIGLGCVFLVVSAITLSLVIICKESKSLTFTTKKKEYTVQVENQEVKLTEEQYKRLKWNEYWSEFKSWWVESEFNEFEVVKNYTTLLSKEDRYRQVFKQVATEKYYDLVTTVTDYYKFQEGTIVNFMTAQDTIFKQDGSLKVYRDLKGPAPESPGFEYFKF